MLSVPNAVIKNVQSELCSFLWRNRKYKIKRAVIYQPLKEGGLNFVNFETMVKCLRLAWINRFLTNSNDSWKAIPNYYFSSYGGLQFLLRCNYNVNYVTKDLPSFYRELLQYFQEFQNATKSFPYSEFLLWNNEKITIENNMLYWRSWFNKKIDLLRAGYLKCRWKLFNFRRIPK